MAQNTEHDQSPALTDTYCGRPWAAPIPEEDRWPRVVDIANQKDDVDYCLPPAGYLAAMGIIHAVDCRKPGSRIELAPEDFMGPDGVEQERHPENNLLRSLHVHRR